MNPSSKSDTKHLKRRFISWFSLGSFRIPEKATSLVYSSLGLFSGPLAKPSSILYPSKMVCATSFPNLSRSIHRLIQDIRTWTRTWLVWRRRLLLYSVVLLWPHIQIHRRWATVCHGRRPFWFISRNKTQVIIFKQLELHKNLNYRTNSFFLVYKSVSLRENKKHQSPLILVARK